MEIQIGAVIFNDVWEASKLFSKEVQNEFIAAICRYQIEGEEPSANCEYYSHFILLKDRLDASVERREKSARLHKAKRVKKEQQETDHMVESDEIKTPDESRNLREEETNTSTQNAKCECKCKNKSESKSKKETTSSEVVKKRPRFVPPTHEEVSIYAREHGEPCFNAQRFCDYYQAQGWRLSNGNTMKDWRAAVRNWLSRDKPKTEVKSNEFSQYR